LLEFYKRKAERSGDKMNDKDWIGPWCSFHAIVVKNKSIIVDEIYEYRRHVYSNGKFKTERISIEDWRDLGFKYKNLPDKAIK